ncbi:MAG TPA: type VI immunity family protein [Roseomonas sp.]
MQEIEEFLARFRSLSDLDKLTVLSPNGAVHVRFGIVVSLFFLDGQTEAKRLAFIEILRHYHAVFGSTLTHYQPLHRSRLVRIRDASFLDHYAEGARAPLRSTNEDVEANDFTPRIYGFSDRRDRTEPTHYYVGGSSMPVDPGLPPISYIDAYIPISWAEQGGWSALVELVTHWCGLLRPMHGTAGLGTLFDQGSSRANSGLTAFPFVRRFVGLDYNDSVTWANACDLEGPADHRVIRTTNWLTVLDDGFVDRLGSADRLGEVLGMDCPVRPWSGGVTIQAGLKPELGDLNRSLIPEHYRSVARVLRQLRFEDYSDLGYLQVPFPLDARDETLSWLRRFD